MSRTPAAFATACAGIATYALMDALMKALSIAIGTFSALWWRLALAVVVTGIAYAASRPTLPSRAVLRVHAARSLVVTVMALAFFWGIARVPLAEAIALSFIAPLIALGLAALFLKERVGRRAIGASLLGLAGVAAILLSRSSAGTGRELMLGRAAVLVSAVFYAANLVMARHQAQLAKPLEITFLQSAMVLALLSLAAPYALVVPPAGEWPAIAAAAGLAVVSLLLLSWAYARAEAQILLPTEYTAFVWACFTGWFFFGERLTWATAAGTVLIVAGCLLAARPTAEPLEPGL